MRAIPILEGGCRLEEEIDPKSGWSKLIAQKRGGRRRNYLKYRVDSGKSPCRRVGANAREKRSAQARADIRRHEEERPEGTMKAEKPGAAEDQG